MSSPTTTKRPETRPKADRPDPRDRPGPSVSRWFSQGSLPDPATAARLARSYDRPVLEAFVAAGFLTPEEAGERPSAPPSLVSLTDDELIEEVGRRMKELRDAGTTHQKMPEPQGRGAYGTAARTGASETDRYRQSIANVGEESQDPEG